ncbi:MAG: ABC transporter permease [Balneolales bacterium]|nr:ABC transporter permease [Balneolales bacterium]
MWRNLFSEFFNDLRRQKLRSSLTITAIAWGTLSVVLLLAFGRGLGNSMVRGMLGAGDQIVVIYGGQTSINHEGLGTGRRIRFTEDDVSLLQRSISGISHASPVYGKYGSSFQYDDVRTTTYMEAGGPDFEIMRTMYPAAGGRFLNQKDVDEYRKVVFLGHEIAENIFGDKYPVGENLLIDGMPFTVIGVMQEKMQTSMNHGPDSRRAVIPYTTFRNIYGNRYIGSMVVRPASADFQEHIKAEITRLMASKYKFDPSDEQAMPMWDFIEMEEMNRKIATGLEVFLFTVGFFTLMIAGVGVANIMYVIVKERTREIGVKKAIGAKRHHIISQILFESIFISFLGGLIGMGISYGIVNMVVSMNLQDGAGEFLGHPEISVHAVLVTTIVLALIGIFAGLFPARKAANMDPVESLRYE